jgi:hypothetical protein
VNAHRKKRPATNARKNNQANKRAYEIRENSRHISVTQDTLNTSVKFKTIKHLVTLKINAWNLYYSLNSSATPAHNFRDTNLSS